MTCVHEIKKIPHFFMLSILCYVPRWKNKGMRSSLQRGWVHSQQDVSYINGRLQVFLLKVTQGTHVTVFALFTSYIFLNTEVKYDFFFPPINLSKIQQKKTFSCKLLDLLLSSYYLQVLFSVFVEFGMYSRNRAVNTVLYINICIFS